MLIYADDNGADQVFDTSKWKNAQKGPILIIFFFFFGGGGQKKQIRDIFNLILQQ